MKDFKFKLPTIKHKKLYLNLSHLGSVLAVLLILYLLAMGIKSIYEHDDLTYPSSFIKNFISLRLAQTDTQKAAILLYTSQELLQDFNRIHQKNYSDPRLIEIAKELGANEHLAISHMDAAKRNQQLEKAQVHMLCETLDTQQKLFALAVSQSPLNMQPVLQRVLSVTDEEIMNAMAW